MMDALHYCVAEQGKETMCTTTQSGDKTCRQTARLIVAGPFPRLVVRQASKGVLHMTRQVFGSVDTSFDFRFDYDKLSGAVPISENSDL